jgi:intracellular septation protein
MKLLIKLLLEFMPLALFFVVSKGYGIYIGSLVLAVATAVTLVIMWVAYRRIAMMAIITAVTSISAGGMTYVLTDPHYVYMKPTIVCAAFALILGGGLLFGKPLLQPLIGEDLHITKQGWMIITLRWTLYFVFIAALNEVLWRTQTESFWLNFKVFGLMPMSILYGLAQIPLLAKYREPGVVVSHGAILDSVLGWFEQKPAASLQSPKVPSAAGTGTPIDGKRAST